MREFLAHQEKVFNESKDRDKIALFMEQRTGKTLVAVRWALHRASFPILVVSPVSPIDSWKKQLAVDGIEYVLARGNLAARTTAYKKAIDRDGFCLCSYHAAANDPIPGRWGTIILDESTAIKSSKALTSRNIVARFSDVRCKAILTGTPKPEDYHELFMQMKFLLGSFMGHTNYWQWLDRYTRRTGPYGRVFPARSIERITAEVSKHCIFLTRKQAGIGSAKKRRVVVVEMSRRERERYMDIKETWCDGYKETSQKMVMMTWLRFRTGACEAKVEKLCQLVLETPSVVVCSYRRDIRILFLALKSVGVKSSWINGSRSDASRTRAIDLFNSRKVQCILLQAKTGRHGIDLSSSDRVIYYSTPHSYEDRAQSEDRIISPTKTRPVEVIDLICRKSIDELVLCASRDKRMSNAKFTSLLRSYLDA